MTDSQQLAPSSAGKTSVLGPTFLPEAYEPSYVLLKESRESWDEVVSNELVYSFDPVQIAVNPLVKIAKDYAEGNVWVELHLTFHGKGNVHYAAIVEADKRHDLCGKLKIDRGSMSGDSSVFVNDAQIVETPQQMISDALAIPSVVRLKRINNGNCLCGYTSSLFPESPKAVGVGFFQNRELSTFGVFDGQPCEMPDQLIQRGSKTIQQVTHNEGNGIRGLVDFDPDIIPSLFRIYFFDKLVRLGFVETFQFLPQSLKVFLRPTCLEIGVSQTHTAPPSLHDRG